jgi:transposase
MTATTHPACRSVSESRLYVAFELSAKEWKLALTCGLGVEPWVRNVPAGDLCRVARVIEQARLRFGVASDAAVVSCYEAGRDGCWIHRALTARGIDNRIIDSASIEVNRRARRAKTDRLDALKLVRMLVRVWSGERGVWREVHVPTVADEAARHVSRERTALLKEQTRLVNQMRSWVATCGGRWPSRRTGAWWTALQDWAGAALPEALQGRLARADARWTILESHIDAIDRQQQAAVMTAPAESALHRLVHLKGVNATSASILLDEGLVWRAFRNRREIGGLLGFAPIPFQSGEIAHDQGISRAGNDRLQAISIQLAWNWVRWQPTSALTQWYQERFARGGKRLRRLGIVAVARRLVIALWRYATTGTVPPGAILKVA